MLFPILFTGASIRQFYNERKKCPQMRSLSGWLSGDWEYVAKFLCRKTHCGAQTSEEKIDLFLKKKPRCTSCSVFTGHFSICFFSVWSGSVLMCELTLHSQTQVHSKYFQCGWFGTQNLLCHWCKHIWVSDCLQNLIQSYIWYCLLLSHHRLLPLQQFLHGVVQMWNNFLNICKTHKTRKTTKVFQYTTAPGYCIKCSWLATRKHDFCNVAMFLYNSCGPHDSESFLVNFAFHPDVLLVPLLKIVPGEEEVKWMTKPIRGWSEHQVNVQEVLFVKQQDLEKIFFFDWNRGTSHKVAAQTGTGVLILSSFFENPTECICNCQQTNFFALKESPFLVEVYCTQTM